MIILSICCPVPEKFSVKIERLQSNVSIFHLDVKIVVYNNEDARLREKYRRLSIG